MSTGAKIQITGVALVTIISIVFLTFTMTTLRKPAKERQKAIAETQEYNPNIYKDIEEKLNNFNNDYSEEKLKDVKTAKILLEVEEYNSKEFNKRLVNYLSNVNGRFVSINGQTITKEGSMGVVPIITGSFTGILPIKYPDTIQNKTTYLVEVPKYAPYKEYLQDILDSDYRQIQKDIKAGKEII